MTNPYVSELVGSLRSRYATETANMSMGEWITKNTTFKSRPFSFEGYGFQRAICDDLHPDMDVLKISQVGLTEVQLRKALGLGIRNPGMVGIFSLPNEDMYRRISQGRLAPILKADGVFAPREGDVRSMGTIQMGQSFLYVVAAIESAATSISADFVMTDEVDLSDQSALALFNSRLQNSVHRIKQRFSTPTWAGFGIHGTYSVSDQREYFCRCSACNHWQLPLFDGRFVKIEGVPRDKPLPDLDDATIAALPLHDAQVVCERCDAPLDLGNEEAREWVAAYPTRLNRRGYRVRPFSTSRLPPSYILNELVSYRRRDYVRGWWNTVVGEPYMDSKARLSEEDIRRCMDTEAIPEVSSDTPVYAGIDMGQVCHMVLGTDHGPFEFRVFKVSELNDVLEEIRARYKLVSGACDRHPYTPTAEEARDLTEGVVLPVEYRGEADLKFVEDADGMITHAQANRTRLLDSVTKTIRAKRFRFAGYGAQASVLIEHLRDNVREESPEKPAKYIKLTGNDHYFHALAFWMCAREIVSAKEALNDQIRESVFLGGLNMRLNVPLVGSGQGYGVLGNY